jgi:hypothetical protein
MIYIYESDPAVSLFRVPDGDGMLTNANPSPSWTIPELCKLAWVAKKVKLTYRFAVSDPGNGPGIGNVMWWHHIYENQNTARKNVCNHGFVEISDGPADDDTYLLGSNWFYTSDENSMHGTANGQMLENQGVLPITFYGSFTSGMFEETPTPEETLFLAWMGVGDPPSDEYYTNVRTREAMLEIVTRDNAGNPKSVFYDVWAAQQPTAYPYDPWPGYPDDPSPWAGEPADWGFRINDDLYLGIHDITPYIKIEVIEWYPHDGTWDTETGELLVPDPWNP